MTRSAPPLATLIASAPIAGPTSIRTAKTQSARLAGAATLYEVRGDGREGGGSLTYRVEGKAARDHVDFVGSSDFGHGGSEKPQIVSAEECRQRLAALGAELAKRKIAGVAVHPEACASADREGTVITK